MLGSRFERALNGVPGTIHQRSISLFVKVPGWAMAIVVCARVAAADPQTEPEPDLVTTVPTIASRAALSELLVAGARKSAAAADYAHAIPLYQALVVARGAGSPEAKQLAELWQAAHQRDDAVAAWTAYAEATTDPAEHTAALTTASRLLATADTTGTRLVLASLVPEARRVFALGRAAFAAQHYGDALVDYHMGYALAPELAGFLRELGATYDKLGAPAQKDAFYRRYLVERPVGANADIIRAELAEGGALGTLQIASSLPCTEVWLNRQRLPTKLPPAGLAVAPGSYKGLCFVPKYEMALFEYATVNAGESATMAFRWAIIVNQLEHPYGRIALENAHAATVMIDLGITSPEVGVAVPADGHPLRMTLVDDTGTRTVERHVKLDPGQRLVVQW